MDGNGRWAVERGLPRLEGHREGVERIRVVLETLRSLGVEHVTIYAFSTENWGRPQDEVEGMMSLFFVAVEEQDPRTARAKRPYCPLGQDCQP